MIKKMALKVEQGCDVALFITTMNIVEIESICTISRVFRTDKNVLKGYQRPEVRQHIDNIAAYIDSKNSVIPNSIIICLKTKINISSKSDGTHELMIPRVPSSAVLVDGQQRVAALKQSGRKDFSYPVCILMSDDSEFERQQFLLINSAKPLSRSLIYELLPHASGVFNESLTRRRLPSLLTQLLNYEPDSTLNGLIKLTTNPDGLIADNSMMKMLDNSLREGALYDVCELKENAYTLEQCDDAVQLMSTYFSAVREVFYDDWGKKPKDSRLFHGVGIISLGQLFDEIYYSYSIKKTSEIFFEFCVEKLFRIKPYCSWSQGHWEFGKDSDGEQIVRKWNQLQNVTQDISMVTRYLTSIYEKLERGVPIVKGQ
ncbi:DGQHR domain-containing protein DpdB [Vibrio alginolyticus]|uniref:DGQHR domain-containing protein DpdB n=1 Tax=Vibrio alginolyticus TaxID=663 RepID=UPI00215DE162|nr:DGQHR domain-containing protein DpdB [Vibrio alginolyticus]MCS0173698.1 DGQHR domain-containing protein [Vibrio alginolyticus]